MYKISPRLQRWTEFTEKDLSDEQKAWIDAHGAGLEVADYDHEGAIVLVPPDWNDRTTPSPDPIRISRDGQVVG